MPENEPSDEFEDLKQARALLRQRIKEKRWAVYVQRAADRFAAWWAGLGHQTNAKALRVQDMVIKPPLTLYEVSKTGNIDYDCPGFHKRSLPTIGGPRLPRREDGMDEGQTSTP